jgi:NADH-quinone oxidoreductase subunit L
MVGALAIAGVPPFSGFFSKDQILNAANQTEHTLAWVLSLVGAFFSALYIARLVFLTFFGKPRTGVEPHESPPIMTVPLVLLALGAFAGGLLSLDAVTGRLPTFLQPVFGEVAEPVHGLPEATLTIITVSVSLAGILLGWYVWGSGRVDWAALRTRWADLQGFLASGWYVDDLYAHTLVPGAKAVAGFAATGIDRRVIDALVNGVGAVTERTAGVARRVQTGLVRNYALGLLIGAVALFLYVGTRL